MARGKGIRKVDKVEVQCAMAAPPHSIFFIALSENATVQELKEAIKRRMQLECPAPRLELFVTRPTGQNAVGTDAAGWLNAKVLAEEINDAIDTTEMQWMQLPKIKIGTFGFPKEGEEGNEVDIHVVVGVPVVPMRTVGASQNKPEWILTPGELATIPLPSSRHGGEVFSIDHSHHDFSGITARQKEPLWIYCRQAFWSQVKFMEKHLIDQHDECWIIGPPGTGKSCTSFAFLASLDRTVWTIVWIRIYRWGNSLKVTRFAGTKKGIMTIVDKDDSRVRELLNAELSEPCKKYIVCLDGIVHYSKNTMSGDAREACVQWREEDITNRHLLCVASLASTADIDKDEGFNSKRDPHTQRLVPDRYTWVSWSWTLDECKQAVINDEIFDSVKEVLVDEPLSIYGKYSGCSGEASTEVESYDDNENENSDEIIGKDSNDSGDDADEEEKEEKVATDDIDFDKKRREALIKSKFNIAGGNARYMFSLGPEVVRKRIQEVLDSAEHIDKYLCGQLPLRYKETKNTLLSLSEGAADGTPGKAYIMSRYAAREIAIKFGEILVLRIKAALSTNLTPSMDGELLEMWFFAKIKNGIPIFNADESPAIWPACESILEVDPLKLDVSRLCGDSCWLRPVFWAQGGYDGVYVNTQWSPEACSSSSANQQNMTLIRFIQITRAATHSFEPQFFNDLLNVLNADSSGSLPPIGRVELAFVVPLEVMKKFRAPAPVEFYRKVVWTALFGGRGKRRELMTRKEEQDMVEKWSAVTVVGVDWDRVDGKKQAQKRLMEDQEGSSKRLQVA